MARKEIAVKKYVVRLSAEERKHLSDFVRSGKRSARLLTKARILLKADVSDAGEGWSDGKIAAALDTSIANIERTRRQLVEEGFEAVLNRRIPDKPTLIKEVAAWQKNRNKHHVKADWQFTTDDARVKLKTLYPQFQ